MDGLGAELVELLDSCNNLNDLYEKSKIYGATKTEVKIDAAVHTAVLEAVGREDEHFQREFTALAAISDRIANKTDFYRTDPAQVFMAAWVLSNMNFSLVAIAPPAAGKTFVFLLVAARCLELD